MACDLPRMSKKNIEAYMLMTVEPDIEEEVLYSLIKIEGITEYSRLHGICDLYCKIEANNMEQLRELSAKIKNLGILTTHTLITRKEQLKQEQ